MKKLAATLFTLVAISLLIGPVSAQDTTMSIKANGRVGIGTTNPFGKLEVVGNGKTWNDGFVFIKNLNRDAGIRLYSAPDKPKFHIYNDVSAKDQLRIVPEGAFINGGISILQTGQVGIGTNTPSAKLTVEGNVKAGTYFYDTERTFKLNIPGNTFTHFWSSHAGQSSEHGYLTYLPRIGGTVNLRAYAPVSLPHKAKITSVTVFWMDNSSAHAIASLVCWIHKTAFGQSTAETVAEVRLSSTQSNSSSSVQEKTVNVSSFVDQDNFYHVTFDMIAEANTGLRFYGVSIEYTMNKINF